MTSDSGATRPWGRYRVLEDGELCKVKVIDVEPGQRLSYQRHERRSEHWFVVAGEATVTKDGEDLVLAAGASVDLPAGTFHRFANHGTELLTFVEVQTGSYFGEDDITRVDDDYGRAG